MQKQFLTTSLKLSFTHVPKNFFSTKELYFESDDHANAYYDMREKKGFEKIKKVLIGARNESVTSETKRLADLCFKDEDFINLMKETVFVSGILQYQGYQVGVLKKEAIRVAITGAAGNIGYALIPRIASGEVFGYDQPVILHLIEVEGGLKGLEGVVMEINDSAFPLVREIIQTSDLKKGFDQVDVAFLVGAKPRGPGMERKDLLKENANIFAVQGKALDEVAKKTCLTLVVGNPANTNALITASNAPSIPAENFSAMMRLDHNRGLGLLAQKFKAPVSAVDGIVIWGNHSATQVPDVTNVTVRGEPVSVESEWLNKEFIPAVQQRGAAIIAARGASSAFSAADAAIQHMRDWWGGSNGKIVSMGVPSDGSYGVKAGLYTSYPVKCIGQGKYEIVQDLKISDAVQNRINTSIQELEQEKDAVREKLGSVQFSQKVSGYERKAAPEQTQTPQQGQQQQNQQKSFKDRFTKGNQQKK